MGPVILQRVVFQHQIPGNAVRNNLAGELIGRAEGQALSHHVVCQIRGIDKALLCRCAHIGSQRLHAGNHLRENPQAHFDSIAGIKNGLLVLLHILVINQRNPLHDGEQRHQIAVNPAAFAPAQLRHIGIFLLRHDGGAGGEAVGQFHKLKLPAAPENDLLGKAGQVHHEDGQGTQQLNGEIPVGNAIDTVHAHAVKAKLLRFKHPVGMVGCSGQRTAADGRHVHAPTAIGKPSQVPQQHHGVGHQVVAEGDGLGALQVGVARHDGIGIGFRLVGDHLPKLADKLRYLVDFIPEIHTEIQRHLVIAAAGGVELLAHIADAAGEHLLHEHMDVLARHVKGKRPRGKVIENFF